MGERSEGYSTVTKAMTLLGAFSYSEPVLGVSELARRLGYDKSVVHRLLTTLRAAGWVERTPDARYRLSLKVYEMGQEVQAGLDLRDVAHGPLERLRQATGCTSHVAVLAVPDIAFVERIETPNMLTVSARLGRRRPAHTSSAGKCLLAFGSKDVVEAVIAAGLKRHGPRSITTRSVLLRALADIRKAGYAVSVDETAVGVTSIGAPIFDVTGACTASVACSGPTLRLPDSEHARLARQVVVTAAEISKTLTARQCG